MANERIKKRRPAGGYGRECIGRENWTPPPCPGGPGSPETRRSLPVRGTTGTAAILMAATASISGRTPPGICTATRAFSPLFWRSAEGQEPKLCWFAGFPTEAGNKIVPLLAVPETEDDAVRYTVFNKSFVTYMCEAEGLPLERARVCDR